MVRLLDATLVGESATASPPDAVGARVLVLGVGNILMGDEGVGIHVLRQLENERPVAGARLLDGGTGGVNLLVEFDGVDDVVMIDATMDGRAAGTVTFLQPGRVAEIPRGLGAHDFGLKDLFAAAALTGRLPRLHLYTISVEDIKPMCTELSPVVAAAIPEVVHAVRALAARLAAPPAQS
jgi:hydrogenase maturation protease